MFVLDTLRVGVGGGCGFIVGGRGGATVGRPTKQQLFDKFILNFKEKSFLLLWFIYQLIDFVLDDHSNLLILGIGIAAVDHALFQNVGLSEILAHYQAHWQEVI